MGGLGRPFSIYILPDVRYAHLGLDISSIRYVCGQEGMYNHIECPWAYIEFAKQIYRRALPYIDNPRLHRLAVPNGQRCERPQCGMQRVELRPKQRAGGAISDALRLCFGLDGGGTGNWLPVTEGVCNWPRLQHTAIAPGCCRGRAVISY